MEIEKLNGGRKINKATPGESDIAAVDFFSFSERECYLKKYGVHSQSFTTLQPDLNYFDMLSIGYIAFTKHYGVTIVLSDPVCSVAHFSLMVHAFHRHFPGAIYLQVSAKLIDILANEMGYYVSQMGVEYKIPLAIWNSSGKSKKTIRTSVNQANVRGIEIREVRGQHDFDRISEQWLRSRACKVEIKFLIRPLKMAYTEGVRHFVAYADEKPVGFILFDPIYKDEKVIAYIPNVSRSWSGFQQGLWHAMMDKAIQIFKLEKIQYIDLGLTPLSGLDSEIQKHESRSLRYLLKFIYKYGGFQYNFKGMEFTKARYKGNKEIIYVGHKYSFPLWALIAIFRKSRII